MTEKAHQLVLTIHPEHVAEKLRAIRNHEYPELLKQITDQPRLVEVMGFIQYVSMQPGGLTKFSADMLEAMPARFGTATMRGAKRQEYTLEERRRIAFEMDSGYSGIHDPDLPDHEAELLAVLIDRSGPDAEENLARERQAYERAIKAWTTEDIREVCRRAAMDILPKYLQDICVGDGMGFNELPGQDHWKSPHWFLDDPIAAVFEMMDRRAAEVSKRLAMTVVASKVFDALDYALEEGVMVRIVGDSRFGKTEAIKAWAEMRPGLARVVKVPSSNTENGLVWEIAQSLGIATRFRTKPDVLKERVRFVLQQSRLFLILDESHFLIPQSYSKTTAPQRLNWVRSEIVDIGLPLALVDTKQTRREVTTQNFLEAADKFVRKTGFAMEQFFGRIYRTVQIPDELPRPDLIAVARIHFPDVTEDQLEIVADMAEMSENYLQTVEAVARLARHIARRARHRRITDADIYAAGHEVLPSLPEAADSEPDSSEQPSRRPAPAGANKRADKAPLKAPARALQPGRTQPTGARILPTVSLRGARPEMAEIDLVPAGT